MERKGDKIKRRYREKEIERRGWIKVQIKSKEEKGKEVSGGRETRSKRQTKRMIKKCRDRKKIIWREKKLQRATYTKQYREILEKRR